MGFFSSFLGSLTSKLVSGSGNVSTPNGKFCSDFIPDVQCLSLTLVLLANSKDREGLIFLESKWRLPSHVSQSGYT